MARTQKQPGGSFTTQDLSTGFAVIGRYTGQPGVFTTSNTDTIKFALLKTANLLANEPQTVGVYKTIEEAQTALERLESINKNPPKRNKVALPKDARVCQIFAKTATSLITTHATPDDVKMANAVGRTAPIGWALHDGNTDTYFTFDENYAHGVAPVSGPHGLHKLIDAKDKTAANILYQLCAHLRDDTTHGIGEISHRAKLQGAMLSLVAFRFMPKECRSAGIP